MRYCVDLTTMRVYLVTKLRIFRTVEFHEGKKPQHYVFGSIRLPDNTIVLCSFSILIRVLISQLRLRLHICCA